MNKKTASVPGKPLSTPAGKPDWPRIFAHAVGLLGLLQLLLNAALDRLTANPIQFIEISLGRAALYMLALSLAVTPWETLTGWRGLHKARRTWGLYAFFYFALHSSTFIVVDYGLDWNELLRQPAEKPFILVGLAAGLILLALTVTSFKYWKKRLGKGWKWLHRTVYLAAGLVIVHYAWSVKGTLSDLSGNILRPLLMGALIAFLLLLRLPPVRRWAAAGYVQIRLRRILPFRSHGEV
ncbi:MAG: ferric reductase-like transmembrane domain-containing protein [Chloroflexi bacterium]|nr:ferric reductase-like transmembrane domain-containing protein [Chloroflexota bacterium]